MKIYNDQVVAWQGKFKPKRSTLAQQFKVWINNFVQQRKILKYSQLTVVENLEA